MNIPREKNLISSTPYPARAHRVLRLFEDTQISPITEPSQLKVPSEPKPIPPPPKASGAQGTGAVRKRKERVKSTDKATPESVSDRVLKQLGVEAQDICNPALSRSRNRYNMFPEPIILDSDEEESVIVKKSLKKSKLDVDGEVTQTSSTKNRGRKKIKEHDPGSGRTSELTRLPAGRKPIRQSPVQPLNSIPTSSKELKSCKTNRQTKSKLPDNHESSPSVIVMDDDDENIFPVYQPGTSIYRTTNQNKIKDKVRLSLELDENSIIWEKTVDNRQRTKKEKDPNGGDSEVCEIKDVKANNNKKDTMKRKVIKNKKISKAEKCSVENVGNKDEELVANGENKTPFLISRFEDVTFKLNKTSGGIIARSLKTDQNDVGYLEVPAKEVFKGEKRNITFVVIEGQATVLHNGKQQTLSPGDMIHIRDDSGYEFRSAGTRHARFLYIKETE